MTEPQIVTVTMTRDRRVRVTVTRGHKGVEKIVSNRYVGAIPADLDADTTEDLVFAFVEDDLARLGLVFDPDLQVQWYRRCSGRPWSAHVVPIRPAVRPAS